MEATEVDVSEFDSDSASSMMSLESTVSAGRKRPLSDDGAVVALKVGPAKRGRGRPPKSGKYVGLTQAKKSLEAAKRAAEQAEREAAEEKEVADLSAEIISGRSNRLSETSSVASDNMEAEGLTATELNDRVHCAVDAIKRVAKGSKGLKGTCQKALKEAAAAIEEAAEMLLKRTSTEEVKRLQAENARLMKEMAELRHEQGKLRADLQEIRQGKKEQAAPSKLAPKEDQSEQFHLLLKEVSSLSARFSVIEGRVLRPPLATDRGKVATAGASFAEMAAKPSTSASQSRRAAQKSSSQHSQKTPEAATSGKGKGKGKSSTAQAESPPEAEQQSSSDTQPNEEQWRTAGANKKAKKAKRKANKSAKQAGQKKAKQQRLRAPQSAAVVITLQPEAKEKGHTYGTVIAKAKAEINLEELGIEGIRCKTTMTGARMLEVAGSNSGPQADALAEKLKATLEPEGVKVSRPTKNAELRILGLDDSVSTEELVAAVARVGDCSPAQVKSSPITLGLTGTGTAVVRCPVVAAKKIAEGGRLLVGWVVAQIKILQPRPLRCYRCLVEGHVGAQCTSELDRSNLCFRCSKPGHKASSCEASPHCVLCAAADKPANHRVGTKTCAAPKQKSKGKPGVNTAPSQTQEEENMDI